MFYALRAHIAARRMQSKADRTKVYSNNLTENKKKINTFIVVCILSDIIGLLKSEHRNGFCTCACELRRGT